MWLKWDRESAYFQAMTTPTLTPLPKLIQLYRDIYHLTETGQVGAAFGQTCRTLDLEIDPLSHRAFELILGKLCEVPRFEGNVHLAKNRKGTTGQHTLMVMPLIAAVGTMALGRSNAARGFNSKAWRAGGSPVADMVHDMCIQVLMHDMGEEIAELSSLSQRRLSGKMQEQPKVERKIAEFTMRLGYYAALASSEPAQQKKIFDREIDAIRAQVDPRAQVQQDTVVGQTLGKQIETCITQASARLHLDQLPRTVVPLLRNYMGAYDEPEGFSHFAYFNGSVVKHCQNMQTVLHMAEHINRDDAVPYHLAQSSEARAALWYADRGLSRIYQTANQANPLQMAIARSCAEMAYAINLAILDAPIACMIDRAATPATESDPHKVGRRSREIREATRRHMNSSMGLTDFSTPEIAQAQLVAAYSAAYTAVREDKAYKPTEGSLADCRELPESLASRMTGEKPMLAVPPVISAFTGGQAAPAFSFRLQGPRAA